VFEYQSVFENSIPPSARKKWQRKQKLTALSYNKMVSGACHSGNHFYISLDIKPV